ncbi:glycosyltransferase [Haloferax larsenii]|uniref:Glycosyl transferase family 21 n=1 Tax=Haloferax larsenii TaxID=302484 RepID=A0A1H7IQ97_HALLR|nr:glycosyltransferase [Haloferax larsenii]SEK62945.1 Glycosyl transferase family 21 [Haloferax larsenii]
MSNPPATTVLLPTIRWTDACDEVADQLSSGDELLVICDDESDPVAKRSGSLPDGVRIVSAGEPAGCSGKANAIIAGMREAKHDRIVWTDDDFYHPPDWLAELHAAYEEHGPVTEMPFFVGRDPLSMLLEPIYAVGGTLSVYADDIVWGGAVLFERSDLDIDAFFADLRRTVSDDGILTEHLDVTPLRRTRRVPVGGSIRDTLERHVRFTQIVRYHDPKGLVVMVLIAMLVSVGAVAFPLPALVLLTLFQLGLYAAVGEPRWTFLLAYPAALAQVPLFLYGLVRRTFVWGGRRYRWRTKFDVEVVS